MSGPHAASLSKGEVPENAVGVGFRKTDFDPIFFDGDVDGLVCGGKNHLDAEMQDHPRDAGRNRRARRLPGVPGPERVVRRHVAADMDPSVDVGDLGCELDQGPSNRGTTAPPPVGDADAVGRLLGRPGACIQKAPLSWVIWVSHVGDERVKQALDIDAIGLHPARLTCKLAGSMTRHSIPRRSRNRANQKPS